MVNSKIKIHWTLTTGYYKSPGIKFIGVGYPKSTGKKRLHQITEPTSCRELFVDDLVSYLTKDYTNEHIIQRTQFVVAKERGLKILFKYTKEDDLWMESAERILNMFEKRMGWKLTKIFRAPGTDQFLNSYLVSGSSKWSHCPQLFSLYLLIIRLSDNKYFRSITKLEDIDKVAKKIKKTKSGDIIFLKELQPVLLDIIDNVKRLFFFRSMSESYIIQDGGDGINDYILGDCDDILVSKYEKYVGEIDHTW